MNYEYVRSPSRAAEVAQYLRQYKVLGWDVETTGLDPHSDKVILALFSTPLGEVFIIDTRDPRCLLAFKDLLEDESIKKIGVNLIFDYCMAKGTAGIETEGNIDLMHGEMCLTVGLQKSGRGLEALSLKYLGIHRDKSLQKSFIGHTGEFTRDQLQYGAEDVLYLHEIAARMKKEIVKEGLWPTWKIENDAIPAFGDCYFHGQRIDLDQWREIMRDNIQIVRDETKNLDKFFGQVISEKQVQDHFSFVNYSEDVNTFTGLDINYSSPAQILYGLQMLGVQVDGETIKNTAKESQKKILHLPVIVALGKYRSALLRYGNYGQNYIDAIHPNTGLLHPRLSQWSTETGRPAAVSTNLPGGRQVKINPLNVPRDKKFRHAFIATAPDRMIATVDFSGAELRIMADQSGDELMVRGFNSGVDFHCYVAALVFDKEKVEKKDPLRQPAKTINFGLAYGMGPGKLCATLNGEGYPITLEESKALFDKYKAKFHGAIAWLDAQKEYGRTHLEIVNCNGRKRRWIKPSVEHLAGKGEDEFLKLIKKTKANLTPYDNREMRKYVQDKINSAWASIEREAANFQVQSVNVEWTKTSMYEIRKEVKKRGYDAKFYNTVYDETVMDTHKNCAEDVFELQKRIMVECGSRFTKRVPVEVEGHLETHWTK